MTASSDRPGSGAPAAQGDWDATTYDRISDPMTRWGAEVLTRLDLHGDETVLDAGAGSGRVTEMLLERLPTGRVVALDAAPSMLVEARKRLARFGSRVTFVESDLLELSPALLGPDSTVDAVLSTATFHWVLDHDRLFANLAAVMRPGATFAAQCGAAGNIAGLIEAVRSTGHERAGRWLYATPEDTRARLERAGFEDVEVWTHPEPTPLVRRRRARDLPRDGVSAYPSGGDVSAGAGPVPARGCRGHARARHRLRAPQHQRPTPQLTIGVGLSPGAAATVRRATVA